MITGRYISFIKSSWPIMTIVFVLSVCSNLQTTNGQVNNHQKGLRSQQRVTNTLVREYQNAIQETELDLFDMNAQLDWLHFKSLRLKENRQGIPPKISKTRKKLKKKIASKSEELVRLKNVYSAQKAKSKQLNSKTVDLNNQGPAQASMDDETPLSHDQDIIIARINDDTPLQKKPITNEALIDTEDPPGSQPALALKSEIERKMSQMELNEWLDVHSKNGHLVLYVKWPIVFESNKISLSDHYIAFLEKLATFLTPYDQIRINLEGHSSTKQVGEEIFDSDWELAVHRAIFVANQLINKGVPSYVFNINSRGQKSNDYYNYTKLDSASKRRVEMTIFF